MGLDLKASMEQARLTGAGVFTKKIFDDLLIWLFTIVSLITTYISMHDIHQIMH